MKKKYLFLLICMILFLWGCSNNNAELNYSDDKRSGSLQVNKDINTNTTEGTAENKILYMEDEGRDMENSGLLLGLKRTTMYDYEPTEYETIWIAQDGGSIKVRKGKGFLSIPYGDSFYKIQNSIYEKKKFRDEADDKSDSAPIYNYEYKLHFIDTIAYPFGDKINQVYDRGFSFEDDKWPIRTSKDEILFAGNKYILINKNYFETGGGTYKSSWYSNTLYELKYIETEYKKQAADLYEFFEIEEEKLNQYRKDYNINLNDDEELKDFITYEQRVSENNPLVIRKNGHWVAALPVEEIYSHKGNGSNHTYVTSCIDITDQVSDDLLCYDDLIIPFDLIKKQLPDARDAVSSPNGSMLAVLVKDRINIYLYKTNANQLKEPDYSIPIKDDQVIVSNQWAINKHVEIWDNTLKNFLTTID